VVKILSGLESLFLSGLFVFDGIRMLRARIRTSVHGWLHATKFYGVHHKRADSRYLQAQLTSSRASRQPNREKSSLF
jgi:hypothetical protein